MNRALALLLLAAAFCSGCKDRAAPKAPSGRSPAGSTESLTKTTAASPADDLAAHRARLEPVFAALAARLGAEGLGRPLLAATEACDREGLLRVVRCFRELDAGATGWEERFHAGSPRSFAELRLFRGLDQALERVQHPELARGLISLSEPTSDMLSSGAIARAAEEAKVDPSVLRVAMELPQGFELDAVLTGLRRFSARSTVASLKRLGIHGDVVAALVRQDQAAVERLWENHFRERLGTWAARHALPADALAPMASEEKWLLAWGTMPPTLRRTLWAATAPHDPLEESESLGPEIRVRAILLAHGYPLEHVIVSGASRDQAAKLLAAPTMLHAAHQMAVDASLPLSSEHIALLKAGRGGEIPRTALVESLFEFGRTLGFDAAAKLLGMDSGDALRTFSQGPAWDAERSEAAQNPMNRITELRERLERMRSQVQQDLQSYSGASPEPAASPVRVAEPTK